MVAHLSLDSHASLPSTHAAAPAHYASTLTRSACARRSRYVYARFCTVWRTRAPHCAASLSAHRFSASHRAARLLSAPFCSHCTCVFLVALTRLRSPAAARVSLTSFPLFSSLAHLAAPLLHSPFCLLAHAPRASFSRLCTLLAHRALRAHICRGLFASRRLLSRDNAGFWIT